MMHRKPFYFYPRPPRGGRQTLEAALPNEYRISIHALREEGDLAANTVNALHSLISIHALREEGDDCIGFYINRKNHFYPRPPRGGRLDQVVDDQDARAISIHALREEGDVRRNAILCFPI